MKELYSRLTDKQRKTAALLLTVFSCVFAALAVFAVRARLEEGKSARHRAAIERQWKDADKARRDAVQEGDRWVQAAADIQELRTTWLFDSADGPQAFRTELQRILEMSGVTASEIRYGDHDLYRNRMRKITADFGFLGTYPSFRRFLENVENHPRAVHVEKIDFRNIGSQPGIIESRITLAGYYVSEK